LKLDIPPFSGFSREAFRFLSDVTSNNTLSWFGENRHRYELYIVLPSKSFVQSLTPFLKQINPSIITEPKFDKTLMRINNDMRFSRGDPYKNYFLIHFGRFKKDTEFFVCLIPEGVRTGIYINNTLGKELYFNKNLPGYKNELIDTFGKFGLNGQFDFFDAENKPELINKNFSIDESFNKFAVTKDIILQKEFQADNQIIYSPDLLNEVIRIYTQLYPLYCFCFSHNPLALIEKFEDQFRRIK
jgi:hypothetical protein